LGSADSAAQNCEMQNQKGPVIRPALFIIIASDECCHSTEMSATLRGELPFIGCHALRNAIDIGNEAAADHPGVIGAIHALLTGAVYGLPAPCQGIIRNEDRCKQHQAGKETGS
jgi:hypothetical protein